MPASADGQSSFEPLHPWRKAVVFAFIAVALWYLHWRIGSINPEARVFSWLIYAAEVYGFATALTHFFMCWRLTRREPPPVPIRASVDVFIPTYNEPVELVRRTVLAAVAMDYPHTTWVLDDGGREEMRRMAEELGARYLARGDNAHAKAGNLNHALKHTQGEFIAVFDADHAPQRNFLTHTLGYFSDPRVGFVQTPQDFYNLDSYQHRENPKTATVWTEQSLFFRVLQRGKDFWNAAFFCGSCAVVRRAALDEIGGFATGTVTEDLHTSIVLHKQGWRSVYHAESLAFGVAPSAIGPFLKQRIRWGQGAMQVWRREPVLFSRKLSAAQKINYVASMGTYFDGWQKLLFYVAPAIVLLTGTLPIRTSTTDFLLHFLPYYLLNFWAFEEIGRGYGRSAMIEQYNMGRFAAFLWSTLAMVRRTLRFNVTDKAMAGLHGWGWIAPQIAILALNAVAVPVGAMLARSEVLPYDALVANSIWAGVNMLLAWLVIAFSRGQSRHVRAEYRFRIPLPARVLYSDGEWRYATIDDISPKGCSLYGVMGSSVKQGSPVELDIFLPGGELRLQGSASNLKMAQDDEGQPYAKGMGVRFAALSARQVETLELFLFGSDLEWKIRGLSERTRTPLEVLGLAGGRTALPEPSRWTTGLVAWTENGVPREAPALLAQSPKDGGQAIVFQPIATGTALRARILGRMRAREWNASVTGSRCEHSRGEQLWVLQLADSDAANDAFVLPQSLMHAKPADTGNFQ